ncbi:hypothetical protein [Wolbachia endosymbiont of Drosophila pseudotakahashii]|uniref:hypothetical protein n=1 Tax=Wolbachia endosymbiont of Drosophila pseudotakahashii TaxID=375919 RepID=UPI00396A57DC
MKSPQDGIVTILRYLLNGGVIQSGVPIMRVVASDDDLIIDAKIQNHKQRRGICRGTKEKIAT